MSTEREINFSFNTAITGLPKETGIWDEKAHNAAVRPLRGLLMQIDGVYGCHIGRYTLKINYRSEIVSESGLRKAAKAAIRSLDLTKDNLFPLAGEKTPAIRRPRGAKNQLNTWWVTRVLFDTDLFFDDNSAQTEEIIKKLAGWLAESDGARLPFVSQRSLYVKFDRREVSPESLKSHLQAVVKKIEDSREENKFFPFAEPGISYEVFRTQHVI